MKKKISVFQLFVLMTFVPYGSAVLFFLAPEAKQDVWIGLLIYSLIGILLQIMYIALFKKYPDDTLISYLPKIYGKYPGIILSVSYIIFFAYEASRVFRDFLELITVTSLQHTPLFILGLCFIIIIIYSIYNGIENIASLSQIYFILIVLVQIVSFILILTTQDVFKLYNLKPILSNGILDLLKKSWPLITYPYGETMVFTMIYPLVIENKNLKKAAIFSIITEAILLAFNSILFISTLGVNYATLSNFPLLDSYRLIQVSDFLSRMDIIYILLFLVGGFFKIFVYLYAAVLGATQILHIKNTRSLAIPSGIVVFTASLIMAKNYPEHKNIGQEFVVKKLYVLMFIIVPFITLLIYYIKSLLSNKPEKVG